MLTLKHAQRATNEQNKQIKNIKYTNLPENRVLYPSVNILVMFQQVTSEILRKNPAVISPTIKRYMLGVPKFLRRAGGRGKGGSCSLLIIVLFWSSGPEIDPFWYVGRGVRPIGRFGKRESAQSVQPVLGSLELLLSALRSESTRGARGARTGLERDDEDWLP